MFSGRSESSSIPAAAAAAGLGVAAAFLTGDAFSGLFVLLLAVYALVIFARAGHDYGVLSPRRFFLLLYLGYGIVPFFSILFRHTGFYQERYAPLLDIFHRYLDGPVRALVLVMAGLLAFEAGYRLYRRASRPWTGMKVDSGSVLLLTSGGFYLFTAAFFAALVMYIMQRLSIFSFLNYSELYEMLGAPSYLVGAGLGWFSVSIVLLYAVSKVTAKSWLTIVSLLSLAGFVLFCVLMGKRRIVITTLLAIVLFRHYYLKRISGWLIGGMFVLGAWFVNLVANLRILNIVGRRYLELFLDVVRSLNPLEALVNMSVISEFQVPFGTFLTLTNRVPSWDSFQAGGSYLKFPLIFIPRSLMENRWDGLGPWFVEHFYPQFEGTGFAFFILGEPYLNFGAAGVVLFMLLFGMVLKYLTTALRANEKNPLAILLISYMTAFLFSFIRTDIVCLRELLYTFLFPILFITVIAKAAVRIHENIVLR